MKKNTIIVVILVLALVSGLALKAVISEKGTDSTTEMKNDADNVQTQNGENNEQSEDVKDITPVTYKEINITDKDNFAMELEFEIKSTINNGEVALFEVTISEFSEAQSVDFIKGFEYFIFKNNPQIKRIEISLIYEDEVVAQYKTEDNILKIKEAH